MWNAQDVRDLRQHLDLDVASFARLVGVDARTVTRWEAGIARPTGAAEAVLNGLREKLAKDPSTAKAVIAVLVGAAAVGGLAYLLVKLLDKITDEE
ncbi:helix-turn-helix domain-containing protein [Candidatus Uhrbacteria bacterium]|nr:helix-turn-helix domain-containing protein [Candidatus Uhrbacteria bacterium]